MSRWTSALSVVGSSRRSPSRTKTAAAPATPIIFGDFLPSGYMLPDEHANANDRMLAKYLGAVEKLANEAGCPFEEAHTTSDLPAEAILQAAHDHKRDLVCMAPHARHGLTAMVLGGQTQKVLAQANVPVIVFR